MHVGTSLLLGLLLSFGWSVRARNAHVLLLLVYRSTAESSRIISIICCHHVLLVKHRLVSLKSIVQFIGGWVGVVFIALRLYLRLSRQDKRRAAD